MVKKELMNPSHVLIFVEGDTDELFFKACATGRSIRRGHALGGAV